MESFFRQHAIWIVVLLAVLGLGVAFSLRPDPPADFTFPNGTEIKTVDPAIVTGQPEGRIVNEIFEGLIGWDAKTLEPEPAVAEKWEISEDGKTYTFHLRKNATWSKLGADDAWCKEHPVVAEDFVYSFRRFLDPQTENQYAQLLYYVVNGEAYNKSKVKPGDKVEVELLRDPATTKRGEISYGKLVARGEKLGDDGKTLTNHYFDVEIEGQVKRFALSAADAEEYQATRCLQVLPDFRTVGIRAKDPHTLVLELNSPVPYFLKLMGFYPLSPVNRECIETYGYPAWTQPENIVLNGPFLLQSRRIRDRIRMVKNPHYWDAANVHLNIVDALALQSETTGLNLYMTGKCDWIPTVPSTIVPELIKAKRNDFDPQPLLTIYYYECNVSKDSSTPLKDAKIRKALSLGINRREIVEKITKAGQIPAERFVPPGILDFDALKKEKGIVSDGSLDRDAAKLRREKDLAEAKRLLAEAGFPGGAGLPKIEILYNTHEGHKKIAELIQSQWKSTLGVRAELVNKEWSSYLADRQKFQYQICRAGWTGDYVDPNTFLDLFITGGPQNTTGFSDPEYDKWLDDAQNVKLTSAEQDALRDSIRKQPGWTEAKDADLFREAKEKIVQRKRMELFLLAEDRLLDRQAIFPLYYYVSTSMVRPYVSGFFHNLQDHHPLKGIRVDHAAREEMLSTGAMR